MAEGCSKADDTAQGRAEGQTRRWLLSARRQEGNSRSSPFSWQTQPPREEASGDLLPPTSLPRYLPALGAPAARAPLPRRRLYISAKFELMMGTVFVIPHQAALVSGIYLSCCFGSFFQSLLSSDMSGLQSKRNSEFTFTVRQAECYYPCICHQPADPSL